MATGYRNNDNVLWVTANDISGAEDAAATVTAVVQTKTGEVLEANIALAWVAARSRYEGQPDESLWPATERLNAVITVTGSQGEEGEIVVPIFVSQRRAT